ncbi:MAG TPA: hypothetical protein VN282_17880 [Pyrinomonadaceae bacterium]|nr:hypothetical protein [Pyrinomonadaceae bacterium]
MSLHTRTSHAGLRALLPALLLSLLALASADARQPGAGAAASAPAQQNPVPASPQGGAGSQGARPASGNAETTNNAVNPGTRTDSAQPTASPSPPPDATAAAKVMRAYNQRYVGSSDKDSDGFAEKQKGGLNDIITIEVANLQALLLRAKCQEPYDQPKPCTKQEISLFINGRAIRGLEPESGGPVLADPAATPTPESVAASAEPAPPPAPCGTAAAPSNCLDGVLRYHLQRLTGEPYGKDNMEHWADLLGVTYTDFSLARPVEVSVGLADEYPVATAVRATKPCTLNGGGFCLIRVRAWRLLIWGVLAVLGLWLLWRLSKRYGLLCDRKPVMWGMQRPYSLSAVQAAWWFVLVVFSFVFIWLVTGQQDLSSTALILLSIGLGTALGATVIDTNKGTDVSKGTTQDELSRLLSQKQQAEAELTALDAAGAAKKDEFNTKWVEYKELVGQINHKFPNAVGSPREGILLDILSDEGGVSFHRFQMLVWTVVLGFFFLYSVLGTLSMPNFSTTLLGLMGISAGTYLGFKIPENTGATAQSNPAGGGPNAGGGGADDAGAVGACCLPDGSCQELTKAECESKGGKYQGDGTTCATVNCNPPPPNETPVPPPVNTAETDPDSALINTPAEEVPPGGLGDGGEDLNDDPSGDVKLGEEPESVEEAIGGDMQEEEGGGEARQP